MIQAYGKKILSMEFKSLIEAHDSNPLWFIQNPILIGNIKAQFLLTLLYQKRKEPKTIKAWQRKRYHVTKARKAHCNYLWRNPKKKMCLLIKVHEE